MKLLELLKESESFENLDLSIERVVVHKRSRKFVISFYLKKALSLSKFKELDSKVNEILQKEKINSSIYVRYDDEFLSVDEYKEYLNHILKGLVETSARFKILDINECKIVDNHIEFLVAYDAMGVDDLCKPLVDEFKKYGLPVVVSLVKDERRSVQAELDALQREQDIILAKRQEEAKYIQQVNENMQNERKKKGSVNPEVLSYIKDIPSSQNEISMYENTKGIPIFLINAYIFGIEIRSFTKTKSSLATIKVTDETDSIIVKKWLRTETEKELFERDMVVGSNLRIIGKAEFDSYSKQVVLTASSIQYLGKKEPEKVVDLAPVKRVELHAHTKMSTLDGITDAADYIKAVSKWGWKSMAFTDHSGVYAVPDIDHAIAKMPDFKPIYGVELSYINDEKYFVTFNEKDILLKDASYVVFDIETTGLSQTYDEIIEIAACKVYQGGIIDTFEVFVNPKMPIPPKISELTTITDEMVSDALPIENILPKFLEFCKGSILVAHNAKFDVGMINRDIKRLGLNVEEFAVIDTLNLFRAGYYDQVKTFNLKSLSKYFKVKQEQHHRAIDDTRVTALCFIMMLNDLFKKNIYNYKDINSIIDVNEHWKHVIPSHISILAKNQVGYKNMYKILSDSLTNHFFGSARALKSVVDK